MRVAAATQALEGRRTERVPAATPSTFCFGAIFQVPEGWTPSSTEGWHVERASVGPLPVICFIVELQPPNQEHGRILEGRPVDRMTGERPLPA